MGDLLCKRRSCLFIGPKKTKRRIFLSAKRRIAMHFGPKRTGLSPLKQVGAAAG